MIASRRGVRVTMWALLFAAAALAGRATRLEGQSYSLVWPAAGVAALWLATARVRTRKAAPELLALASVAFVVNVTTGADALLAAALSASNVAQAVAFVAIFQGRNWRRGAEHRAQRSLDDSIDAGLEPGALHTVRQAEWLFVAAMASCLLGAAIAAAGLGLLGRSPDWTQIGLWWCRNLAGLLLVFPSGLLIRDHLASTRQSFRARESTQGRPGDWIGLVGLTVVLFVIVVLGYTNGAPLGFVLLFAVVVASLRVGVLGVNIHAALLAVVVVIATLMGQGPFASLLDPTARALVAQAFLILTVMVALLLSLNGAERDDAVHQLRAARGEAADRASLFAAVLENMREGVAVVQDDGTVLVRNPVGRRLLDLDGTPSPVVLPAKEYGLHHTDGRPLRDEEMPFSRVLAGEESVTEEYVSYTPSGSRRIVEVHGVRLPGLRPGDPVRAVISFRDVTAAHAERDNLAAFAGVVAHDLINPLGVIRGWADTLSSQFEAGPVTPADGVGIVDRIQLASASMGQLIDDLLSYTVTRDAALHVEDLDLSELAEEVAVLRRESDSHPEITVHPGMCIEADRALVRQLVDNLVGNAVKYVGTGVRPCVEISARDRDGMVEVSIADNGIGVPEEARDRIFENFQRAHSDQAYRGTGLGLAICRQVVERHGGTICVRPNPDGGSLFRFTLPPPSHR